MNIRRTVFANKSTFFTYCFYLFIVLFILIYLKSIDWGKFDNAKIDWFLILAGTFFGIATRYCGAYIWLVLLKGFGAETVSKHKFELFYVYAKSWLGRYIPGTAPWILGKIYFASKYGVSKSKLGISSLLEASLQIIITFVLSLAVLLLDKNFNEKFASIKYLAITVSVIGALLLIPRVFNPVISKVYSLIKKTNLSIENYLTNSILLKGIALYSVFVILNGISLFLISKGFYSDLSYQNFFYVFSVANLAGVIGMLAVFLPSGLGAREGVLVLLLVEIMPVEVAFVIAVATRLAGVVWDVAFFASTKFFLKFSNNRH